MQCSVEYSGDYALITSKEKHGSLKLDLSQGYCRIFETAKQQSRDYLDEVVKWCGVKPENLETLHKSLHMVVLVRRRQFGLRN